MVDDQSTDPNAPSPEPSHGVAPAQTPPAAPDPEVESDLEDSGEDESSEAGAEPDLSDTENDEIEEAAE